MSYVMNGSQNLSFLLLQKRCRMNLPCWKGEYSCDLYVEDSLIFVRIIPLPICFVLFFFFFSFFFFFLFFFFFFFHLNFKRKYFSSYEFHAYFFSSIESFFPSTTFYCYFLSFLCILLYGQIIVFMDF